MNTYSIFVECRNDTEDRTVQVQTSADLRGCDEDMLACEIETCLEQQHGLVMGENLLHWEYK